MYFGTVFEAFFDLCTMDQMGGLDGSLLVNLLGAKFRSKQKLGLHCAEALK